MKAWRARHAELGLWLLALLLCCAAATLWPHGDVRVAAHYHRAGQGFAASTTPWVIAVYQGVPWLARIAALWLAWRLWRARRPSGCPRAVARRAAALLIALVVGVGLVVNGGLKEHWGRPRPRDLQPFGGTQSFVPALQASTQCTHNCSFVSGHAATGFALMAVGTFAAARRRRRWVAIGWAAGLFIGWVRVMQGGHFVTDVLFAGLVMWGCVLATRAGWLQWRAWLRRSHAMDHARARMAREFRFEVQQPRESGPPI